MKIKLLILGALLVSATAFGQSKRKSQKHPLPPNREVKTTHGTVVSDVAQGTHDGKTVSAVASSKNKGKHHGDDQLKQPKVKKHKHIKKTPVQKKVSTPRPDVPVHPKV